MPAKMTVMAVDLPTLKRVKNSVIGNPSAKLAIAQDIRFITMLVHALNNPPVGTDDPHNDIRIEAAHVITSLTYGSHDALRALLHADALQALLYAISNFRPADAVPLKEAFARALRALAAAVAEVVGPSQWGLKAECSDVRMEAKAVVDYLFQLECLDIFLPLLSSVSPHTSTSISQLLGALVRSAPQRACVAEWLPPAERVRDVKGKRGWERPDVAAGGNAPGRGGGWVVRHLVGLVRARDVKLQEAALAALASLSKDNFTVASALTKVPSDREPRSPLSFILSLTKARQTDVQLAACLCATHIIRTHAPVYAGAQSDSSCGFPVLHVVNRIIAAPGETAQARTRACFIVYYLVIDEPELCGLAVSQGSLDKIATLVKGITPLVKAADNDEDEPESVSALREAALMAIAALSLYDNDVRRELSDTLALIPLLLASLAHAHAGVRHAALQCARALGRVVAVLRTGMVDSGLGAAVFAVLKKEGEDRRVLAAALAAVCNIVNDFSPLRQTLVEQGLLPRLVQLMHSGDPLLRLNALWAVKNLLRKTTLETKKEVMAYVGWKELVTTLRDDDAGAAEQAWNIVRNLAEDDPGIELVFREIGADALLDAVAETIETRSEEVVLQATYALANLANAPPPLPSLLLSSARLLRALHAALADASAEVRRPAVSAALELAREHPRRRRELGDAGVLGALRRICEGAPGAGGGVSPGGAGGGAWAVGAAWGRARGVVLEDDREVRERAKEALDWLEHSGDYEL